LELSPDSLIRHYDINGKDCPKYFVDHEDAWKQLKKDVKKAIKNTASQS
ncbi:MAG: N-acetylmuramoyl-L-alanine amidase, partial [Clostridia bacterium]|nr:N-acetylmuramoyl-L-alanine amidase [Clostridia bacterium]